MRFVICNSKHGKASNAWEIEQKSKARVNFEGMVKFKIYFRDMSVQVPIGMN
jgi:hypothetical protein